jgi:hypothetical protein
MKLTTEHLEFLRAKCDGLIRQVLEEEGIEHGTIYVSVHDVAELPELRFTSRDEDDNVLHQWSSATAPDSQLTFFQRNEDENV